MNDLIKKGFLIGLGATIASKEKAEKLFEDLSKSGGAAAEEAKALLTALNDKGKENTGKWRDGFEQEIIDVIKDLGFVTLDEFNGLKEKLTALENQITELKSTATKEETDEK